jgi:hypothetical protein
MRNVVEHNTRSSSTSLTRSCGSKRQKTKNNKARTFRFSGEDDGAITEREIFSFFLRSPLLS